MTTDRPKIVCLCGSTRFWRAFMEANHRETLAGRIVLSVGCFVHQAAGPQLPGLDLPPLTEADKAGLDQLHLRKIDLADEVLVLNCKQPMCPACDMICQPFGRVPRSGCCDQPVEQRPYIGESTRREIDYALSLGKPVRYLEAP